jgi:hypothetical protein
MSDRVFALFTGSSGKLAATLWIQGDFQLNAISPIAEALAEVASELRWSSNHAANKTPEAAESAVSRTVPSLCPGFCWLLCPERSGVPPNN